ncbi:MAG TPA: hypothetical protein VG273_22850 [Bryobacteraceae bacterium]|nr:hypothetical protein [Bryobacteraceae bacterium]
MKSHDAPLLEIRLEDVPDGAVRNRDVHSGRARLAPFAEADEEWEDLKLAARILLPVFAIEPFWWLLQAGKECCLRWIGF